MAGRDGRETEETTTVAEAGEEAARVIAAPELRVIAAFERSFYAEDGDGRLACFLGEGAESGPLHVLCRDWRGPEAAGVRPGTVFTRADARLSSPGLVIKTGPHAVWRPAPFPRFAAEPFRRGFAALRAALPAAAPPRSLPALLFLRQGGLPADADPLTKALVDAAADGTRRLLDWLEHPAAAPAWAPALLGLGPGLTPSGDDILAGVLLALHAVGDAAAVAIMAPPLRDLSPAATNPISRAHLLAALDGAGAAAFHDLLTGVLTARTDVSPLLERIARVGHSSGWDALFGILLALDRAARQRP